MIEAANALNSFQTAAGISPDKMSEFIRTVLLVVTFGWAAWCIKGLIHHVQHRRDSTFEVGSALFRIAILVVLMMVLVFV